MYIAPILSQDYLPAKEKVVNNYKLYQKIQYGREWLIITRVTQGSLVYYSEIPHERGVTFGYEAEEELKTIKKIAKKEWDDTVKRAKNGFGSKSRVKDS